MFWTFTEEETMVIPLPDGARNQTFSMVMLLDWKTFRPFPEGGARMLDWFAAPMIVRLLLLLTAGF